MQHHGSGLAGEVLILPTVPRNRDSADAECLHRSKLTPHLRRIIGAVADVCVLGAAEPPHHGREHTRLWTESVRLLQRKIADLTAGHVTVRHSAKDNCGSFGNLSELSR